jgi:hypothetical protein
VSQVEDRLGKCSALLQRLQRCSSHCRMPYAVTQWHINPVDKTEPAKSCTA